MTIDYNPLFEDVSKEDLHRFRRQEKAGGATNVASIFLVIAAVLVFAYFSFFAISAALTEGGRPERLVIVVVIMAAVGAGGFFIARALFTMSTRRRYRMTKFATRNGLLYSTTAFTSPYPGAIFSTGNSRQVYERLWRTESPSLDIGNYRYTTGSGKNKSTHLWHYLALRLPRRLPHMMLDAKGNNSIFGSNLPVSFGKNQRLSLEGDFDKYFTLYCPREYETDALYVFTPDLMALLIDDAANLDVEIIDDWMLVYSKTKLDFTDAAALRRLFTIVDTVGTKTAKRSSRYADDRVTADRVTADRGTADRSTGDLAPRLSHNLIAPKGSRLKQQTPILAFAIVAVIVVIWFGARFVTGLG